MKNTRIKTGSRYSLYIASSRIRKGVIDISIYHSKPFNPGTNRVAVILDVAMVEELIKDLQKRVEVIKSNAQSI